jgi:hypothetical protein
MIKEQIYISNEFYNRELKWKKKLI